MALCARKPVLLRKFIWLLVYNERVILLQHPAPARYYIPKYTIHLQLALVTGTQTPRYGILGFGLSQRERMKLPECIPVLFMTIYGQFGHLCHFYFFELFFGENTRPPRDVKNTITI